MIDGDSQNNVMTTAPNKHKKRGKNNAKGFENDPKQQDKYQDLLKQSDALAAQALTAGAAIWQPIYDQINLTVPGL